LSDAESADDDKIDKEGEMQDEPELEGVELKSGEKGAKKKATKRKRKKHDPTKRRRIR